MLWSHLLHHCVVYILHDYSVFLPQAAVIAKYDLPRGRWEELSTFVFQSCRNPDPQQREVCIYIYNYV